MSVAATIGGAGETLTDAAARDFVVAQLADEKLDDQRVLVIVPDGTRSCPLPMLLDAVREALAGRASAVTVLVALGTHAAMSDEHLARHLVGHRRAARGVLRRTGGRVGGLREHLRADPRALPGHASAAGAVAGAAKYDDMWTGAKGFYKVEPIVADGGQVIVYAPHITEIAATHPAIEEIGYHCRDYFLKQWDRFQDYHWGDLAHSTHLRGAGSYDPVHGERGRVTVTLATGIPEDVVRAVNLDYLDPAAVDVAAYRHDPETLVVPDAGEVLLRLRQAEQHGS